MRSQERAHSWEAGGRREHTEGTVTQQLSLSVRHLSLSLYLFLFTLHSVSCHSVVLVEVNIFEVGSKVSCSTWDSPSRAYGNECSAKKKWEYWWLVSMPPERFVMKIMTLLLFRASHLSTLRILIFSYFICRQTTILYKLKLGEVVTTIPTIGKINNLLQNILFFCICSSAFPIITDNWHY